MNTLEVQRALTALGFKPGSLDGLLGKQTKEAIRAFQAGYRLVVDGIAGPQTKKALKEALAAPKPGRPEPDKVAMAGPAPAAAALPAIAAAAPPNVSSLKLLSTARPISTLFIHCAATAEGKDYTVADIRAWHKARGWSDIGYHYVVYRDGSIQPGRPIGQVGAHVEGHNTGSVGIVYVGGVAKDGKTAKDTRTPAQRASLLWLTKQLVAKHGVKRVRGHNEVAAKACPSFTVAKDELGRLI
ncbi:peptidoglycan-binding protein [Bosea massiliensis]|uniref:Peptidoglycan-binding protein n=1 Tax=Bosea massiliensis TaxID=151419 RepID=A0ABW0P9E5_9HYPH